MNIVFRFRNVLFIGGACEYIESKATKIEIIQFIIKFYKKLTYLNEQESKQDKRLRLIHQKIAKSQLNIMKPN